jgi:polysaccharide export outer membrane protein
MVYGCPRGLSEAGLRVVAALLAALFFSLPTTAQTPTAGYLIGPKDLLEIKVQEIPELNVERRVQDDGTIDLPLLGLVPVSGDSPLALRDRLAALLMARYVNQAYVTVNVKEYANRPILILGGVVRPGSLNLAGRWTLQQAILNAGGLAPGAGKKIAILRTADNGLTDRIEVDSDELFVKLNPVWNVPIYPGDVVNVGTRQEVVIYFLGEFKTTGAVKVQSDEKLTLLRMVARVGGLTDRAAKGSLRVKRTGPDGKTVEIEASYSRILSGKDPDLELMPDDVVIARESLF